MSIKSFRKPGQLTPEGVALANNVDDYTRQLTKNPILDYALLKRVELTTTTINVPHGLGRPWTGWVILRTSAGALVWETATQTDPSKYLSLTASADTTVDIYII